MLLLNLFVSFIHFLFCYLILITALVSNNIKVLTFLFFIMVYTKILYNIYNRCILTIVEDNVYYPNVATLFIKTLTKAEIPIHEIESILINMGILILVNKIFVLLLLSYYKVRI
jgi:hypothetical protein